MIRPRWANRNGVGAVATTRFGGVSRPPYDTFNLGYGVVDEPDPVDRNRRRLIDHAGIGGTHCDGRFFSHRRDGPTGRCATLIWRQRSAIGEETEDS